MAAVREDVVKIGFAIDMAELTKLASAIDNIKKSLTGGLGDDALDELISDTQKATESVREWTDVVQAVKPDGIEDCAKGLKETADAANKIKPDGLEDVAQGAKDTDKNGEKARKTLKEIAQQNFDKAISGLKSMATTLGKIGLAAGKTLAKGIAAGVAGVGALVTKSVMSFADYEQLEGGVKTLFKDSAGTVLKYADEAWIKAGVSANTYMETVTSFSASLINSLGGNTGAAAEYANMALKDMSDNANKMGTDMATLIGTYQSMARGNWAMLDNLKLGYGGTKEEMQRLLKTADELNKAQGKNTKYSIDSFADIVDAIHVVQESMGITGTTALEATETISGSFNAMKAAWGNTMTALVLGGDDFDRCIDNLVESGKNFAKNVIPAIVKALGGVGSLIEKISPMIEKELPGLVKTMLPPMIKAATSLVKGLIVALPDIISTIIDEIPTVLSEVWKATKEAFGDIPGLEKAEAFFGKLKTWFTDNADTIKSLAPALLGLVAGLKVFNKIKSIITLFTSSTGGKGSTGAGKGGVFNPKTALNFMGSIAIAIAGVGLIIAAFAGLKKIEGYDEFMAGGGAALKQLCDIIADVGLVGAAFVGFVGVVGKNVTIAEAATGIGDIAIALMGMEGIVAAFAGLAKIDGYTDFMAGGGAALKQLCGIIEDIGLIGAAFVGVVAVVGTFANVATAANGMGVIAIALGGMEAIVLAFGALSKIEGIDSFIEDGGNMLTTLCNIIGDMAGNLVEGALAGISDGLPTIGDNISAFAESVAPALETFGSAKTTGISDFASSLSSLIGVLVSENISSFFFGEINYAELGTNLSSFATNASTFFSTVKDIPSESFCKMTSLFNALAEIKGLPTEGGLKSFIAGDVKFDKITSGLVSLAGDEFISAIKKIQDIPATGFTAMTNLFNALADIKDLPKEGGIFGWFTGSETTTLSTIAEALPGIATNISTFYTNLGGMTDFSVIGNLFTALNDVKIDTDATKGTGLLGLGDSALTSMGKGLSSFATNAKTFFDTVNGLNVENLTGFFDNLGTAGELPDTLSTLDSSVGTSLSNLVTTADTKLLEVKSKFSNRLGEIIVLMNTTATTMFSSGASIMEGVDNGMESMRSTLVATAASIAADIQKAFDVKLDINSPSRETFKSGVFVGEGYDLGMQSKIPDLKATASRMGEAAIPYTSRYTPDSDSGTVSSRAYNSTTTISPSFNLSVSGTQDDRTTARKVKQWVQEAMTEVFESLDRITPEPREA